MNTRVLEKILSEVLKCNATSLKKSFFTGVYPIDQLSMAKLSTPGQLHTCVINSHKSSEPGEHWLVVGIDLRYVQPYAFIFDSLH